jgi:hypothetical protein
MIPAIFLHRTMRDEIDRALNFEKRIIELRALGMSKDQAVERMTTVLITSINGDIDYAYNYVRDEFLHIE